ncbi:hypothetical protein V8F06_013605 [Rhypophila decipiens]
MRRITFSYPISREYPYDWFPWVVVIGGTVFSLATKGYYLEVMFTRNPNVTEAELYWFSRAPFSWTDPLSATCQAAEIQVGTSIFTDKLWRAFTISRVNIRGDQDPSHEVLEPVLVYKNNVLEDCTVGRIVISVRNETTLAGQYIMSYERFMDRLNVWAEVICNVNTDPPAQIYLSARLTNRYGTWQGDAGVINNPSTVTDSMRKRSGVIVGEFLLSLSDQLIKRQQQLLTRDTVDSNPDLVPAIYQLTHNHSIADITSPEFLVGTKMTPAARGPSTAAGSTQQFNDFDLTPLNLPPTKPSLSTGDLSSSPVPPIIDRIAKVFYSLLLADLGQPDDTVVTSRNILVDWTDELMELNDEATGVPRDWTYINYWKDATVDMALPSKDNGTASPAGASTIAGGIGSDWTRSTIYTQYTCQVPKQRVTGSVIIAVFISDLVLLQALWTVFTWGTMWWMQRGNSKKRDTVMYCQGCVAEFDSRVRGGHGGRCDEQDCEDAGGGGRLKKWTTNTGRGIKGLGRSLTGLTAIEDTSTKAAQSLGCVFGKGSSSDNSTAATAVDITNGGKL